MFASRQGAILANEDRVTDRMLAEWERLAHGLRGLLEQAWSRRARRSCGVRMLRREVERL